MCSGTYLVALGFIRCCDGGCFVGSCFWTGDFNVVMMGIALFRTPGNVVVSLMCDFLTFHSLL